MIPVVWYFFFFRVKISVTSLLTIEKKVIEYLALTSPVENFPIIL